MGVRFFHALVAGPGVTRVHIKQDLPHITNRRGRCQREGRLSLFMPRGLRPVGQGQQGSLALPALSARPAGILFAKTSSGTDTQAPLAGGTLMLPCGGVFGLFLALARGGKNTPCEALLAEAHDE